jgi:uncharacterized protein YerC
MLIKTNTYTTEIGMPQKKVRKAKMRTVYVNSISCLERSEILPPEFLRQICITNILQNMNNRIIGSQLKKNVDVYNQYIANSSWLPK